MSERLTDEVLAELAGKLARMTPGEWDYEVGSDGSLPWVMCNEPGPAGIAKCVRANGEADAAGIAALRNAGPALVAEVASLRAAIRAATSDFETANGMQRAMGRLRDALEDAG